MVVGLAEAASLVATAFAPPAASDASDDAEDPPDIGALGPQPKVQSKEPNTGTIASRSNDRMLITPSWKDSSFTHPQSLDGLARGVNSLAGWRLVQNVALAGNSRFATRRYDGVVSRAV